MVASKRQHWRSGFVPGVFLGLLFLIHGGDARLLRIVSETAVEVAEVIHRRLQAAPYCIAIAGANETMLQDALNWACGTGTGQGNVDCSAIQQGGSCYDPNTLSSHASYAFNQYYVKQGGSSGSCSFGGVATTTSTNPSSGSCVYPTLNGAGTPSTNGTGTGTGTAPPPPSSSIGISPISATNSSDGYSATSRLQWFRTLCTLLVIIFWSSRL